MPQDTNTSSTAEVFGSPGEGARVSGLFRVVWPFLLVLLAAGYLLGMAIPVPGLSLRVIGFGLLLAAGLLGWAVPWSEMRFEQYAKGAQGEEAAARMLAFLPAGYYVFHSMPMKGRAEWSGRNFDHVVVGPSGLFVVETKNWTGQLTVENGDILFDGVEPDRPPVPQVIEAAEGLQRALQESGNIEIPVQPLLCFAGDPLMGGIEQLGPVRVCDLLTLREVLLESGEDPLGTYACREVVNFLEKQYV